MHSICIVQLFELMGRRFTNILYYYYHYLSTRMYICVCAAEEAGGWVGFLSVREVEIWTDVVCLYSIPFIDTVFKSLTFSASVPVSPGVPSTVCSVMLLWAFTELFTAIRH